MRGIVMKSNCYDVYLAHVDEDFQHVKVHLIGVDLIPQPETLASYPPMSSVG